MIKSPPRKTNRLVIETTTYYWKVVVTPDHGKQVTAMFDNRNGGSDRMGNTPSWFISALHDLRDINKYPHIHDATDQLARLVQNVGINNAREGGKRPWADVELDLRDIAILARDGFDPREVVEANTYKVLPEDDVMLPHRRNFGFAAHPVNLAELGGVCEGCKISPCWC